MASRPPSASAAKKHKGGIGFWVAMGCLFISVSRLAKHSDGERTDWPDEPKSEHEKKPGKGKFAAIALVSLILSIILCVVHNGIYQSKLGSVAVNFDGVTMLGAGFVLASGFMAAYQNLGAPKDGRGLLVNEYTALTMGGAFLLVPEVANFFINVVVPFVEKSSQ